MILADSDLDDYVLEDVCNIIKGSDIPDLYKIDEKSKLANEFQVFKDKKGNI